MHIQSSFSFISPSHTPPKLYAQPIFLTCCILFFSSWLQMVEIFTLLLSVQIRGKHLSFSCRPLASPMSSMGPGNSFFLNVLVRSPFCSSLQGYSELPGQGIFLQAKQSDECLTPQIITDVGARNFHLHQKQGMRCRNKARGCFMLCPEHNNIPVWYCVNV